MKRQLAQLGYNENPPLSLILCTSEPDSTPPPLQTLWAEADIQTIESDPAELAVITAARIAEQGEALAIDLRRDALAMRDRLRRIKTPFWSAVAAAFLLLITLTTVNLWRIHHYATRIANTQIDQETLFRETFPGQNAPAAVTARLRSEHHHLTHLTSTTSMEMGPANSSYRNQKQADRQTSKEGTCFSTFRELFRSLPRELRYRVLEVRVDDNEVYINGQARSHSDADLIAANLRRTGVVTLKPPRTEKLLEKGIVFTLTGTPTDSVLVRGDNP